MCITYDKSKDFWKNTRPHGPISHIYKGNVYIRKFMYSYLFVVHEVYINIYTHILILSMVSFEQPDTTACTICSYGIPERSHQYFRVAINLTLSAPNCLKQTLPCSNSDDSIVMLQDFLNIFITHSQTMQISGETARYELTHLNLHCLPTAQYCLWR